MAVEGDSMFGGAAFHSAPRVFGHEITASLARCIARLELKRRRGVPKKVLLCRSACGGQFLVEGNREGCIRRVWIVNSLRLGRTLNQGTDVPARLDSDGAKFG